MTSQSLINEAFQVIGVYQQGETPSSDDSDAALIALQDLNDSLSSEKIMVPSLTLSSALTLVSGTQSYTIGSGGTFNIARPIHIESAELILVDPGSTASGKMRVKLELIPGSEFAVLSPRTDASTTPRKLYNDYAQPLSTLYLWPIPTWANNAPTLELLYWTPITTFTALGTTITLPPAYQRMFKYNLALDLAPMFGRGAETINVIAPLAAQSKAVCAALNRQLEQPQDTFPLVPQGVA